MNGLNLYAKIEQYLGIEATTEAIQNTFKDIVEELNPKTLLDIGCGQGQFLSGLTIKSLGIDLSSIQVDIAKQKGINAKCIELCKVDEKFDCATAIFDVVNYIPKKNIRNFFQSAHKVLNKDGYFLFDINTLYGFEEVADGAVTINNDDKFIAIDAVYENKILETSITVFFKEKDLYKKEMGIIKQFYHTQEFLTKELELCGFDVESAMSFTLHDVEEFDKQIYIAKKK